MTTTAMPSATARPSLGEVWLPRLPGLGLVAVATVVALLTSRWLAVVSALIVAIALGALLRNTGLVRPVVQPGTRWATKRLLRAGVVLLGLQLSIPQVLSLSPGELVTIVLTVAVTFLVTRWFGHRLGATRTTSLLIATGFAICGASAVAAMSAVAPEDERTEEDVATAIAMVTLFGSVALVLLPLLQGVTGLDDRQMGVWIGASVHEVAQVVAAASAVSAVALSVAVVVKLGRVVLLAPLVAAVGAVERRRHGVAAAARSEAAEGASDAAPSSVATPARPPLVPLFVLGFLGMVVLRSTGLVPEGVLDAASTVTTALLTAAMFGLGTGVHLPSLLRTGGKAIALGAVSTAVAAGVSLIGIYALT